MIHEPFNIATGNPLVQKGRSWHPEVQEGWQFIA